MTAHSLLAHLNAIAYSRVLICMHVRPDGDALGASFGLYEALKARNCPVMLYAVEPRPDYADVLFDFDDRVITDPADPRLTPAHFDRIVAVDTANRERLSAPAAFDLSVLPVTVIDHHGDNTRYGADCFIAERESTCGFLAETLSADANCPLSCKVASALCVGLLTDTGGFRYNNTDSATFQTAAALLSAGADYQRIVRALYFSIPFEQKQFQADLFQNHLVRYPGNRVAALFVPPELLERYHMSMRNAEFLVEEVRVLRGVDVALLFSTLPDSGGTKVSLRSADPAYAVVEIAHAFEGGGHALAAGCTVKTCNQAEAAERIADALKARYPDLFLP